jgi:hypothetical protein
VLTWTNASVRNPPEDSDGRAGESVGAAIGCDALGGALDGDGGVGADANLIGETGRA